MVCHILRLVSVLLITIFVFGSALAQSNGVIFGEVFNDENGDAIPSEAENRIPGWPVYAVGPGGTRSVVTNASGQFFLSGLEFGQYTVFAGLGTTTVQTFPKGVGTHFVNVTPIAPIGPIRFGQQQPCLGFTCDRIVCVPEASFPNPNSPRRWRKTLTVKNNSDFDMGKFYFEIPSGFPGTVSPTSATLTDPIEPGESQTFQLTLDGIPDSTEVCIRVTAHTPDLEKCCEDRYCFVTPKCDCFQFLEQTVVCLPDGSFQITVAVQNLSSFNNVNEILLNSSQPIGATITPDRFSFSSPMSYGQTRVVSFNVSGPGVSGNTPFYFFMAMYAGGTFCCSQRMCVQLPPCGPCKPVPNEFCPPNPDYDHKLYNYPDLISFVTCWSDGINAPDPYVLAAVNMETYSCRPWSLSGTGNPLNYRLGVNWNPNNPAAPLGFFGGPGPGFHNEGRGQHEWSVFNLGSIFATTIDKDGYVYVAQTSMFGNYNSGFVFSDRLPNATTWNPTPQHAQIYKIHPLSGSISKLNANTGLVTNTFPNAMDPSIAALDGSQTNWDRQAWPELGDLTYDYDNNCLWVTNLEDGRIYKISMTGVIDTTATFDPIPGANTTPGFAPLGQRIWAIEYHGKRLYYSVWEEDSGNISAAINSIRSVEVSATGQVLASTDRHELHLPGHNIEPNPSSPTTLLFDWSSPVSDIAFSREGKMLVAERTMGWPSVGFSFPALPAGHAVHATVGYAHRSRGMEFECIDGEWELVIDPAFPSVHGAYSIGDQTGTPSTWGVNSAGGADYDLNPRCAYPVPGPGIPVYTGSRLWFTGDYLGSASGKVYGLQGTMPMPHPNPGRREDLRSILIDLNYVPGTGDKTEIGDVEIPCNCPQELANLSEADVTAGILHSGSIQSILLPDFDVLCILTDENEPIGQLTMLSDAVSTFACKIRFTVKTQTSCPGRIQCIDAYNWVTGSWVTLNQSAVPSALQTTIFVLSQNAAQFVNPANGLVRWRLTFKPGSQDTSSGDGWVDCIDFVLVDFVR